MNLTALYGAFDEKSGKQPNNMNELVAAGLLYIISRYITYWTNNFVITVSCNKEHTSVFYDDLFERMFGVWSALPVQIVNIQKGESERVEGNRYNNMIFIDSYESFVKADFISYTSHYDRNEYYYIFLQNRDAVLQDEMQKIFEYCWQHQLINCIIQIQNVRGELLIYTYMPFSENYCRKVEVVLVNKLNGTSLEHESLIPWKLRNFHGCPLKIATWHEPPYVYLSNNTRGKWEITDGFEGLMLLEFSRKLNFTLEIAVPANGAKRGTVMKNGTITGAFKMLHEREVDMSIGSILQSVTRSAIATPTLNYYQSTFSVVALDESYHLTSLEMLLFPFQQDTWFLVITMNIIAVFAAAMLRKIYRTSLTHDINRGSMDVILMLVGMPMIYKPKKVVTRICITSWTMYALLIRISYQALLFHMIRTHITINPPSCLEELTPRGVSMAMNWETLGFLGNVSSLSNVKKIGLNESSDLAAMKFLERLPLSEAARYVATLPMDFISYYIQNSKKGGVFRIFPYHVIPFKVCIYLPKHSFLIEHFEAELLWLQETGLINAWSQHVLDNHYVSHSTHNVDRLFGIAELQMVFVLILLGHSLATIVFLIELFYKKFRLIKV